MRYSVIWLLVILAIAVVVRFYRLGEVPYGLHFDEASMVYNGWSMALWHRDETARLLPLSFRSFGDFKPPVMIYLLGLIYSWFGLQIMAVRVISAVAGVGTVAMTYFLGKAIFREEKKALTAAGVLAISSWSVTVSRVGYEQHLALFFLTLGVYGFLKLKERWWWLLAAVGFALSLYTFHTAKIIVPILLPSWWSIKRPKINQKIILFIGSLVFMVVPLLYDHLFGQGGTRAATLIFSNQNWLRQLVANVSEYLSPRFWIWGYDGVSIRHVVPGFGVLYYIEFALLVVGMVVTKNHLLRWWFVAGIFPGLFTLGAPHALRTLFAVVPEAMLVSLGLWWGINRVGKFKHVYAITVCLLFIINFGGYLRTYFGSYAVNSAQAFNAGLFQALDTVDKNQTAKISVSDSFGQPYVYVLLHNRITPQDYLWGAVNNYQFGPIEWEQRQAGRWYIGLPHEIPINDPTVVKVISVPGTTKPAVVVAKT